MTKLKVLFELRPALDGFAGIPQETRLLFRHLQHLQNFYQVDGLIQDGSKFISATDVSSASNETIHRLINASSKTVVSLSQPQPSNKLSKIISKFKAYPRFKMLQWQAYKEMNIPLGYFYSKHFGDFIWDRMFSKSLNADAKKEVESAGYRVLTPPHGMFQKLGFRGITFFHDAKFPTIDTREYDFFITQTPYPGRLSKNTQLIVRYHDAVPMFYPHTIHNKKFHQSAHYKTLKQNVEDGAIFACVSQATKDDLLKLFPNLEPRAFVIHNFISEQFARQKEIMRDVKHIIFDRACRSLHRDQIAIEEIPSRYLLMVSTLEPRKNHRLLIEAWERVRATTDDDVALILVGSRGWNYEELLERMKPGAESGKLFHLQGISSYELNILYQNATATICPSVSEGFDFSGIEAMQADGFVIASDIPVHHEVYGKGAAYFDTHSVENLYHVISNFLSASSKAERKKIKQAATSELKKFSDKTLLSKWKELLQSANT